MQDYRSYQGPKFSEIIDNCGALNGNYLTPRNGTRAWLTGVVNQDGTLKSAKLSYAIRNYPLAGSQKLMEGREATMGKYSVSMTLSPRK